MGRPLSVTLADIHMIRIEKDIVTSLKPIFYKRLVDDIYNRRKKGIHDYLDEKFKFTIEINPNEFLDTEIIDNEGAMETKVYRKTTKLPFHSSPNIPKKYKRNNTMHTDLYRAKRSA